MPIIVAKVTESSTMERSIRAYLINAGIPEYSPKESRSGFEVWHSRQNEGEVLVLWRSFAPEDYVAAEQLAGLRQCAAVLLVDKYWVRLETPSNYTRVNQPTLRLVHNLEWIR